MRFGIILAAAGVYTVVSIAPLQISYSQSENISSPGLKLVEADGWIVSPEDKEVMAKMKLLSKATKLSGSPQHLTLEDKIKNVARAMRDVFR
jgi:hypothetical protein